MPSQIVDLEEFLRILEIEKIPLFDARSENEFLHSHIPGAFNLPLLRDEERKQVGTIFKNQGREAAILKGFELVGPRFHQIIKDAEKEVKERHILLYCWRGGMRSNILAWLLSVYGFHVTLLSGGYKLYRRWVANTLQTSKTVVVLGGPTGSGKTALLHQLADLNEQVIDLEHLANHKGSAFGALGLGPQPSNEHFENLLAQQWSRVDCNRPVWLENESKTIGSCILPPAIYHLIRTSPLIDIKIGDERRYTRIQNEYGIFPIHILKNTTEKIKKRLGPQHLKQANELLTNGDFRGWLEIVMSYYDKLYAFGTETRNQKMVVPLDLSAKQENTFADEIKSSAYALNFFDNLQTDTIEK